MIFLQSEDASIIGTVFYADLKDRDYNFAMVNRLVASGMVRMGHVTPGSSTYENVHSIVAGLRMNRNWRLKI